MSSKDPENPTVTEKSKLLSTSSSEQQSNDDSNNTQNNESIWHDAKDTILLGIPIFWAMLSWVGVRRLQF